MLRYLVGITLGVLLPICVVVVLPNEQIEPPDLHSSHENNRVGVCSQAALDLEQFHVVGSKARDHPCLCSPNTSNKHMLCLVYSLKNLVDTFCSVREHDMEIARRMIQKNVSTQNTPSLKPPFPTNNKITPSTTHSIHKAESAVQFNNPISNSTNSAITTVDTDAATVTSNATVTMTDFNTAITNATSIVTETTEPDTIFSSSKATPTTTPNHRPTEPTITAEADEKLIACSLSQLLQARCPTGSSMQIETISLYFDAMSNPLTSKVDISDRAVGSFRELLSDHNASNLIIEGRVFTEDLRWMLKKFSWTTFVTLSVSGLQKSHLNFSMFGDIKNLKHLILRENKLRYLHASIDYFPQLGQLELIDLRSNRIYNLDPELFHHMTGLKALNVSSNFITSISKDLFKYNTKLKDLFIQKNQITKIDPGSFDKLTSLQRLHLGHNQISSIDAQLFYHLTLLEEIALGQNTFRKLPSKLFWNTQALRYIEITDTFLETIPPDLFSKTKSVQTLWLFNSRLQEVSSILVSELENLEAFSLSGNRITTIPPNMFRNSHRLRELFLNRNSLALLPPNLLQSATNLKILSIGSNLLTSIPETLLKTNHKLTLLSLPFNRLTTIPSKLFEEKSALSSLYFAENGLRTLQINYPLINLRVLSLTGNPIEILPNLTMTKSLETLQMNGHHLGILNVTQLFALQNITRIEVAKSSILSPSKALFPADELGEKAVPQSLKFLDIRNVIIPELVFSHLVRKNLRLRHLRLGWNDLDEKFVSIQTICNLLDDEVNELYIENTSFQEMDLCQNRTINGLVLPNNKHLKQLRTVQNFRSLNVSGCINLQNITALSAEILDISSTSIALMPPMCELLGTRVLVARNTKLESNIRLDDVGDQLKYCLSTIEFLDVSNSAWLNRVDLLTTNPIVLSSTMFWSEDFTLSFENNPRIPVLAVIGGSVTCQQVLGRADLRQRGERDVVSTELTYRFICQCARRFVARGNECVSDDLSWQIIVGIAVGIIVLACIIIGALYRHYRRRQTILKFENEDIQYSLLRKEEEVIALKKAWHIDFSELRLKHRIDVNSQGAFGDVFLAQWDDVSVAVKILRNSLFQFDSTTVNEFEKEVEFLQRTRHPHVVRFFGAGSHPNGSPFLVLEYVPLGSLQALLEEDLEEIITQNTEGFEIIGRDHKLLFEEVNDMQTIYNLQHAKDVLTVFALKVRLAHDISQGMAFIHRLGHMHR